MSGIYAAFAAAGRDLTRHGSSAAGQVLASLGMKYTLHRCPPCAPLSAPAVPATRCPGYILIHTDSGNPMQVEWTSYNSPIGMLTVVECDAGPLAVEFPHRAMTIKWAVRLRAAVPELHIAQGSCRITTAWLDEYFAGSSRPFPYPDYLKRWFDLSPAQVAVFKTLRKIPLGETRSYDDVARATGLHPRQIGWLVSANHLAILIPCHRVVGKDGTLVGYGGGLAKKRWLLDHELRAAGVVLR